MEKSPLHPHFTLYLLPKTFESVYKYEEPGTSQMIWVTFSKALILGGFIFRFLSLNGLIYRSTGVAVF